jgi:hypothetical protein
MSTKIRTLFTGLLLLTLFLTTAQGQEPANTAGFVVGEAVPVDALPPGTLRFREGISLRYPQGWAIHSDTGFIESSAALYQGASLLAPDAFVVVTVNDADDLDIEAYTQFIMGFSALLYTGREDFNPERDVLAETLEDGREVLYLDTSGAEMPLGNLYIAPVTERYYLTFMLSVIRTEKAAAYSDDMLAMIATVTADPASAPAQAADAPAQATSAPDDLVVPAFTPAAEPVDVGAVLCDTNSEAVGLSAAQPAALAQCPANCQDDPASVWGSDVYTYDSSVCRAAIHAGVITDEGGPVQMTWLPGVETYIGSERNGVQTAEWGQYYASFAVSAPGETPELPDLDVVVYEGYHVLLREAECSRTLGIYDVNAEAPYALFVCPAGCANEGHSLWGTDVYTLDSSVCAAALHSGALPSAGGLVLATWLPGQESYAASERNGISSSEWGQWGDSFQVEAFDLETGAPR